MLTNSGSRLTYHMSLQNCINLPDLITVIVFKFILLNDNDIKCNVPQKDTIDKNTTKLQITILI